jgi:hypothetical protein
VIQILRETHEAPEAIHRILESYGGHNRFDEPNFRAVWSESRLDRVCGKWTDTDESGEVVLREVIEARYVPKYWVIKNRWVIERWYPQILSPAEWYRKTQPAEAFHEEGNLAQLGPYPSRGEYRLASVVQNSDQSFVQLTIDVVEEIIWKWGKQRREQISKEAAVQADKDAHAAIEAAKDAREMDFLNSLAPEYGSSAVFQTR